MSAFDSADAAAVAQMTTNNPQGAERYPQLFSKLSADILVAGTMKTITTNTQL